MQWTFDCVEPTKLENEKNQISKKNQESFISIHTHTQTKQKKTHTHTIGTLDTTAVVPE